MIKPLKDMTQAKWNAMTPAERDAVRDNSCMTPQLHGLEGWRVEVVTKYGEKRRFIVGRSTGWRPIHLEIKTSRSTGGGPAESEYALVTKIRKER